MSTSSANEVISILNAKNRLMSRRPLRKLAYEVSAKLGLLGVVDRVYLDKYPYPHYAYGVFVACLQAKMLGLSRVTCIEFGVAGGNGLVAMESAAHDIGRTVSVDVDVVGVDCGSSGLPSTNDTRDIVYWFKFGAYQMDVPKLRARLKTARLILGDIRDVLSELLVSLRGPIGFCSFDMDYYSSTASALRIFDASECTRMPRVLIYADDIYGYHDLNIMCEELGEECAFREFNHDQPAKRILPIRGLEHKRPRPAAWNRKMYALHDFSHPLYNQCINPFDKAEASRLHALRG